ncbi:MAG: CPBP family intramembrane glutamic endopeptidase [Vagococcus sp.]|uniref:CPBP family intramembrane glutamic endopeptidase n=1 Tax=Vagococcus sp. TaxID=1933889 RepID=UPI002FC777E1
MTKIYLKLIGFGVLLTLLISIFSALGIILKLDNDNFLLLQIIAFAIATVTLIFYMQKKGHSLQPFGFKKGKCNPIFIIFMLIITSIQPVVMGINHSLSLKTIVLIIIQMLLVGFVEETLFRSIYLFFLSVNTKRYILFSSVVFGLLHVATGINPEFPMVLVILQIVNALLLGIVFALLYLKTQTIYTTIFFHAGFNILASVSLDNSINNQILSVSILVVFYIIFIFFLLKKERKH